MYLPWFAGKKESVLEQKDVFGWPFPVGSLFLGEKLISLNREDFPVFPRAPLLQAWKMCCFHESVRLTCRINSTLEKFL